MSTMQEQPPIPTLNDVRRGDAMIIVLQSNQEKSLIISKMNPAAEHILGCGEGELLGHRLKTILGSQTANTLVDSLEYVEDAPDFGELFPKLREMRLRKCTGEEIPVACKLTRLMAQGQSACFQLVIPDEQEVLAAKKLREFIALNLEGRKEVDTLTGLPNHKTAQEFIPMLKTYLAEAKMNVVFAVIRVDRHAKSVARYGQSAIGQLLQHVHHCCRTTFRADDLIFALSDHTLGIVLFDISRESSRVVLNRLRWKISSHRISFGGKADFSVTICISFDMLNADSADKILEECEKAMGALDANERNALIELGAA